MSAATAVKTDTFVLLACLNAQWGHQAGLSGAGRSDETAIDRPRWRGCLHAAVAHIATQLRPRVAKYLEAGANVVQHLCDVFAEFAQSAAAVGARLIMWYVGMGFARKMPGQRAAKGLGRRRPLY